MCWQPWTKPPSSPSTAGVSRVEKKERKVIVSYEQREEKPSKISPPPPACSSRTVTQVEAGQPLTEGSLNPHRVLKIQGREACQMYLMTEVQKVYRSQGQNIHDKHFEVIIRKMMSKVQVTRPGDTKYLPGDAVDRLEIRKLNEQLLAEGKQPAKFSGSAAGRHQGIAQHRLVPLGLLLPAHHQGAGGRGHRFHNRPALRPEGERDHRQAHPGRHRLHPGSPRQRNAREVARDRRRFAMDGTTRRFRGGLTRLQARGRSCRRCPYIFYAARTRFKKTRGTPTRGKTASNRLRRVDNFILLYEPSLLTRTDGLFAASSSMRGVRRRCSLTSATALTRVPPSKALARFRRVNPDLKILGVEIDKERVEAALPFADDKTYFRLGGFNLPLKEGEHVRLIRAFNVLRQYEEKDFASAYERLAQYVLPGGLMIEGTSNPFGSIWCANLARKNNDVTLSEAKSHYHENAGTSVA